MATVMGTAGGDACAGSDASAVAVAAAAAVDCACAAALPADAEAAATVAAGFAAAWHDVAAVSAAPAVVE